MLSFMIQHEETTEIYINELLKVPSQNPEQKFYWFPTSEDPGDPTTYTPNQQRIYNELLELKELEQLNPQDNEKSRKTFVSNFDWTDTQRSTQKNRNKLKKSSLNSTTFLPDIDSTLAPIVNSRLSLHQTMTDKHTVKVYQHQSTLKMTLR